MLRLVAVILALVFAGTTLASAADLAAEPVKAKRNTFGKCSTFSNLWIYGDPRDCPNDETVPLCTEKNVVAAAQAFFDRANKAYRVVKVKSLTHVREVLDHRRNPSPLMRRYCAATAMLDNGRTTSAHFFVEEDAGFVGISWAVEGCLMGYDKWRVYDGKCRVARPVFRY